MTPEEEERVRALLRAAAEPVPMPEDVADRLDAVLAGLAEDRPPGSSVADLSAARRRRRWVQGLVAAAAVVAVVTAGGPVLRAVTSGGGGSQSGARSSAQAGAEATAPSTASKRAAASQARGTAPATPALGAGLSVLTVPDGVGHLHAATLGQDVRRLLAVTARRPPTPAPPGGCTTPRAAAGASLYAVRLDGTPATLVVSAPRNGTREVRVYGCDDPGRLRAATTVGD